MVFSNSAESLFEDFHDELYTQLEEYPEKTRKYLQPYIKRWSPYAIKISMILQQFIEPGSRIISGEAMEGAIEIVQYAVKSTAYLFNGKLGLSKHQQKVDKVIRYIANRYGSVNRKQLLQSHILEGGAKDYDYILETLKEQGRISETKPSERGGIEYRLT